MRKCGHTTRDKARTLPIMMAVIIFHNADQFKIARKPSLHSEIPVATPLLAAFQGMPTWPNKQGSRLRQTKKSVALKVRGPGTAFHATFRIARNCKLYLLDGLVGSLEN